MEAKILKSEHGQFLLQEWDGINRSGIEPLGDKLVVLVDPSLTKTAGGIHLTADTSDRQTLSSTTGVVVAIGAQAFAWNTDGTREFVGRKPVAGDRVYFQRYAGQEYPGADGKLYLLIQDRSIGGVAAHQGE